MSNKVNLGSSIKVARSDSLISPNKATPSNKRNADFASRSNIYDQGSAENLNMLAANGDFQTLDQNEKTMANADEYNMQEDRKNF
jgi:hypothetical protein